MIPIDLDGQTAIVTGASQGIGLATARTLHQAGANVVVNYLDLPGSANAAEAHGAVAELGSRAVAIEGDVRDEASVQSLFDQTVRHFGAPDILVNNAAVLRDKTIKNLELDDWNAVIDTNLTGVYTCCRAASTQMNPGGRIVNLASISAVIGFYGQANYAAAKAGVVGLTKVLSREFAKVPIRVNAVAPGVVMTEMGKMIPESVREVMLSNIPLRRFAEPDEVANVILFLVSPLASYITGQTLHVNGGWWG